MPQLVKLVEGYIYNDTISELKYVNYIVGNIQQEDYINLNGFIAFLQDFSKTEETFGLAKPLVFGLNKNNLSVETLNIDY